MFWMTKANMCDLLILDPAELSFKSQGKMKLFSGEIECSLYILAECTIKDAKTKE